MEVIFRHDEIQTYYFNMEYVKGKMNLLSNALPRVLTIWSFSQASKDWRDHLLVEYSMNTFVYKLMERYIDDNGYKVVDDVIY